MLKLYSALYIVLFVSLYYLVGPLVLNQLFPKHSSSLCKKEKSQSIILSNLGYLFMSYLIIKLCLADNRFQSYIVCFTKCNLEMFAANGQTRIFFILAKGV